VSIDRPFAGTLLAILEAADGLNTDQTQPRALRSNLSATIFVHTPGDPSAGSVTVILVVRFMASGLLMNGKPDLHLC
jgi:hypothetical protein